MEITCPHCQSRHAAEAEVCPVCGTPVASALAAGAADAPAPQRAAPTAPADRAGVTVPMEHAGRAMRHPATALVAPWRLVVMGITVPLILAPLAVFALLHLAPHTPRGDPSALPAATSTTTNWPPSGAMPTAAPTPSYPNTPRSPSPTPNGSGGGLSPTATPIPTAAPSASPTPTLIPPTPTLIPPTPTAGNGG